MSDNARSQSSSGASGILPGARFVDPRVLSRIDSLELLARYVVEGFISGLHRSPHLGFSTDFAEHRAYNPGDDIRHIDWRLYARTDRFYLKEFEADTNTNFLVLLDASASMAYGSHGVTKLEYAKYVAACLSYLANRQRDRVGLIAFAEDIVDYVPPSAKHLLNVLHSVDRLQAKGRAALYKTMLKVSDLQRRRGIILLISDLYESTDELRNAIAPLRDAGHDVVVMHVLDPAEVAFPFDSAATFEDMETGERLPIVPGRQRKEYADLVTGHLDAVERLMAEGGVDYLRAESSRPVDDLLFAYLLRRERLRGMR